MPRKQRSDLSAGIFVVVSLAAILGIVLWLGAVEVFKPKRQQAFFYVKEGGPSGGLGVGSFVEFAGGQIGKIVQVRIQPEKDRTLFVANIEHKGIQIHTDGTAEVKAGLIGGAVLAITRGSPTAPLADEDHPIQLFGGLDQAMGDITRAAETIKNQLDPSRDDSIISKLNNVIASLQTAVDRVAGELDAEGADTAMAKVHSSLSDVNAITTGVREEVDKNESGSMLAKLHGIVDDTGPKLSKTMTAVRETAEKINAYTQNDIAELLATFRKTNTKILEIAQDFGEVSKQAKEIALVHREDIDETLDNMRIVSAEMKATSREIRRAPWRLIHKPSEEELRQQTLSEATRAFLGGAEKLDQALAKLTGLLKVHPDGIDPKDPQYQEIRQEVVKTFGDFKKVEDALWSQLQ